MKRFVFILLLFSIGCGPSYYPSKFYVKSFEDGYRVCSDDGKTACFSRPFNTPQDAQKLSEKLNSDMEGNWQK